MSRMPMFNSPLLLGFDQLERTLDRLAKNAEGYPPYNIERIGENGLRITLAVAGFTTEDLAIELVENQLTVRGRQADDADRVYLHRGIAARQFQRAFMLADGIEITGARLSNGLLAIDLVRPVQEPRIRRIKIDAGESPDGDREDGPAGNTRHLPKASPGHWSSPASQRRGLALPRIRLRSSLNRPPPRRLSCLWHPGPAVPQGPSSFPGAAHWSTGRQAFLPPRPPCARASAPEEP